MASVMGRVARGATVAVLALGLLVSGLVLSVPTTAYAQTVGEVGERDRLIADQEALLNVYRCMFNIDTEVVPGRCSNGAPVLPPEDPDPFSGVPTIQDIAIRDQLVADQEALLNVYRCMFSIDTELVPGGCPEPEPEVEEEVDPPKEVEPEPEPEVEEEVDPPKEVETEPEPEVEEEASHPCAILVTNMSKEAFLYVVAFDSKVQIDGHFCCPNALQIDFNLRCFGDKDYEYHHDDMYDGCPGGWIRNWGCPGHERYGTVKCASGALQLADAICPGDYGYGYYGYGYGTIFTPDLPYLKCSGGVIMDAYGRCPGDEFYYGEQQCPDGGSVIDYYGRCPGDDDYGMGWKE